MADIYYLIIYVFLTIVEMYLNYKLKKSVEKKSEIAELDKLKTKKNKTLEDQLRFMDLTSFRRLGETQEARIKEIKEKQEEED